MSVMDVTPDTHAYHRVTHFLHACLTHTDRLLFEVWILFSDPITSFSLDEHTVHTEQRLSLREPSTTRWKSTGRLNMEHKQVACFFCGVTSPKGSVYSSHSQINNVSNRPLFENTAKLPKGPKA